MSISWIVGGAPGEHHEHQLDSFVLLRGYRASIMSISWTICTLLCGLPGEYHEHQLDTFALLRGYQASIMSISWTLSRR